MYQILDLFFLTFHSALILFNLFGWVHPRTRPWHLLSIGLTLASWTIMGYWYGWGYCICTDLHWQILRKIGHQGLPNDYITYLVHRLIGVQLSPEWAERLAIGGILLPLFLSLLLIRRKKP